jgi:hypothetical protein
MAMNAAVKNNMVTSCIKSLASGKAAGNRHSRPGFPALKEKCER